MGAGNWDSVDRRLRFKIGDSGLCSAASVHDDRESSVVAPWTRPTSSFLIPNVGLLGNKKSPEAVVGLRALLRVGVDRTLRPLLANNHNDAADDARRGGRGATSMTIDQHSGLGSDHGEDCFVAPSLVRPGPLGNRAGRADWEHFEGNNGGGLANKLGNDRRDSWRGREGRAVSYVVGRALGNEFAASTDQDDSPPALGARSTHFGEE